MLGMLNRLKGVFASFQKHDVRYLVIGGIASILYGVPRATFDLDVLIEATLPNAQKLLEALVDAEMGTATLTTAEEILSNEITVFKDRVRIDVQTSTPGLIFRDAWERREKMVYQEQEFYVVSKNDLIASKRFAGREIDLSDLKMLEISRDKKTAEEG